MNDDLISPTTVGGQTWSVCGVNLCRAELESTILWVVVTEMVVRVNGLELEGWLENDLSVWGSRLPVVGWKGCRFLHFI